MSDKKDEFAALTPEEIANVEDAALRSAANMGLPRDWRHVPGTVVLDEATLSAEIMTELEKGQAIEITQTDTVQAKIAELPCIWLAVDFLVEVLTPIHLAPRIFSIPLTEQELSAEPQEACRDILKQELLKEWHEHFKDAEVVHGEKVPDWIKGVQKVELIECDLLVPKEKK
jgi:hypothetical protein